MGRSYISSNVEDSQDAKSFKGFRRSAPARRAPSESASPWLKASQVAGTDRSLAEAVHAGSSRSDPLTAPPHLASQISIERQRQQAAPAVHTGSKASAAFDALLKESSGAGPVESVGHLINACRSLPHLEEKAQPDATKRLLRQIETCTSASKSTAVAEFVLQSKALKTLTPVSALPPHALMMRATACLAAMNPEDVETPALHALSDYLDHAVGHERARPSLTSSQAAKALADLLPLCMDSTKDAESFRTRLQSACSFITGNAAYELFAAIDDIRSGHISHDANATLVYLQAQLCPELDASSIGVLCNELRTWQPFDQARAASEPGHPAAAMFDSMGRATHQIADEDSRSRLSARLEALKIYLLPNW